MVRSGRRIAVDERAFNEVIYLSGLVEGCELPCRASSSIVARVVGHRASLHVGYSASLVGLHYFRRASFPRSAMSRLLRSIMTG
jgi:hypothetical protein